MVCRATHLFLKIYLKKKYNINKPKDVCSWGTFEQYEKTKHPETVEIVLSNLFLLNQLTTFSETELLGQINND